MPRQVRQLSRYGYVVNALMKIAGQNNLHSASTHSVISRFGNSRSTDLEQRCHEFLALSADKGVSDSAHCLRTRG